LDVDDAIWVYRNGFAAKRLAKVAEGVICGNTFLAEQFAQWNNRLFVVPTPVDTTRYVPWHDPGGRERLVLGWIGTGGGLRFLKQIEPALAIVLRRNPKACLRVISDVRPEMRLIPGEQLEYIVWSRDREVADLQTITVGLMPLDDSIWARGKCSYKMLTYMACRIPVVVSPVGMNSEVLARGTVGLPAESQEDWVESIEYLLKNREAAASMGQDGRRVVLQHYSITALAPVLAGCLWSHSH
jgi:glycosyltransferase involved in cell wall biosynthesis